MNNFPRWSCVSNYCLSDKGMNKCLLHSHFREEEWLWADQIQIQDFLILKLPWWLSVKESACQCRRYGIHPWFRKIPWRREWQLTPVFLPGKSHGQRRLAGYSPWGHKESDMTERLSTHTYQKGFPWWLRQYRISCQSRLDAWYWILGASALGRPRGMVWGGRREEGSGWGTHVYLWWIHFDIWQN